MAADKGQLWHKQFEKLKADAKKAHTDLQRWELLGSSAKSSAPGAGERAALGADIRVRVQKAKQDLERLQSQLDTLPQQEATQKTVTQWRDELALVSQEIQDAHQRVTRKAANNAATGAAGASTASFTVDSGLRRGTGAELQPVSNRALLEQQKQAMRDIEDSLTPLEGTVNNLHMVGTMINREIREQNTMLENVNADTDRVLTRMDRVKTWVGRVGQQDKTRVLGCLVIVLFAVLIVLIVKFLVH